VPSNRPSASRATGSPLSRPGPLQPGAVTGPPALPVSTDREGALPPRILIVMADQWPRATLRAALREIGYDAIGTRSLSGALAYAAWASGRGPVCAIVVDAGAMIPSAGHPHPEEALAALGQRHGAVPLLLLGSAVHADPAGAWTRVLRRPFSIQDVVAVVSEMVPLAPEARRPIDTK
jgi:hypothetical protein